MAFVECFSVKLGALVPINTPYLHSWDLVVSSPRFERMVKFLRMKLDTHTHTFETERRLQLQIYSDMVVRTVASQLL